MARTLGQSLIKYNIHKNELSSFGIKNEDDWTDMFNKGYDIITNPTKLNRSYVWNSLVTPIDGLPIPNFLYVVKYDSTYIKGEDEDDDEMMNFITTK